MELGASVTVTCSVTPPGCKVRSMCIASTDGDRNAGAGLWSEAVTRDRDVVDAYRDGGCGIGPGGVRDEVTFAAGLLIADGDLGAGDDCSSWIQNSAADRSTYDLGA